VIRDLLDLLALLVLVLLDLLDLEVIQASSDRKEIQPQQVHQS
jgi:hypothetical protein